MMKKRYFAAVAVCVMEEMRRSRSEEHRLNSSHTRLSRMPSSA